MKLSFVQVNSGFDRGVQNVKNSERSLKNMMMEIVELLTHQQSGHY